MVLLHYLQAAVQAGITRYSQELAAGLERIGEPVQEVPVRPYEFMLGKRRTGGYASIQVQNLVRPLRKRDVLHSTHFYAASWRADVVTTHDCFPDTYPDELDVKGFERRVFQRRFRHLERRQVQYIAPTEAVKQTFLEHYPTDPERIHVTYEGIPEHFHPTPDAPRHEAFDDDALTVLTVGDLNPRKRLDWVMQAALEADRDVRVVHIGAGIVRRRTWEDQRRREAPLEERLGERFTRLGHVSEEDLLSAYRSADLFVLASLDEGFGFPPVEALACGAPVAVTDRPVFREVLKDQASFFNGPDDLTAILDKAQGRGDADAEATRHGFVREHYDWDDVARRTRDVYDLVREGRRAR